MAKPPEGLPKFEGWYAIDTEEPVVSGMVLVRINGSPFDSYVYPSMGYECRLLSWLGLSYSMVVGKCLSPSFYPYAPADLPPTVGQVKSPGYLSSKTFSIQLPLP